MPKIFISYRRDDSQYQADRLHAVLKRHVRNPQQDIFIDIDNIPVGADFFDHIDRQVAQCDVLFALIGPTWLDIKDPNTGVRRLDDPKDFVRIEIASAMKRGIPVAPILLDGTVFPSESGLPDELKPLARRNGAELRRATFESDVDRLMRGLAIDDRRPQIPPPNAQTPSVLRQPQEESSRSSLASEFTKVFVVLAILIGIAVWLGSR